VAQEPSAQTVREELEKILASPGFVRNQRMGRFLRFVVEHHLQGGGHLKESTLGVEVFGRKPDYDPKIDSIVRTEAARLRNRLAEYYSAGEDLNGLVIELPKGGYTPVFRSGPAPPTPKAMPRNRFAIAVAVAVLLPVLWLLFSRDNSAPSIAVIPIQNLSAEPENEFFADGLTDELIRNLSIIEDLDVRSRTSSFAFKNKSRSVREVGKQLGADYVLEGSMLSWDTSIRINIQLVRVSDDVPVWSGRFDRDLEDIFVIQDEIARSVVNGLRLKLGRGKRRYTTNLEAYTQYLKARSLLVSGRSKETRQSIELLHGVIAKAPEFAPAHAGLAAGHALNSMNSAGMPAREAYPLIRSAAEKAIELDPLLPEAHYAMGLVYCRDRDWTAAEQAFRRAIELDPSFTLSYVHLAYWVLYPGGRIKEALRVVDRAAEVDPLSLAVPRTKAWLLMTAGRHDEVIAIARQILAADPDFAFMDGILARALVRKGNTGEAISILSRRKEQQGFLAYAYVAAGRRAEAEALVTENRDYPSRLVHIYAALGDRENTLQALEHMADLEQPLAGVFTVYPEFAFLRDDARFGAFRKKLGLTSDVRLK
jgi:TolB-like protein/Tfp pilus assembly protein PilF